MDLTSDSSHLYISATTTGRRKYVWTDNSTATKINILRGMFEGCNIPASELVFEFRSEQEGEYEE